MTLTEYILYLQSFVIIFSAFLWFYSLVESWTNKEFLPTKVKICLQTWSFNKGWRNAQLNVSLWKVIWKGFAINISDKHKTKKKKRGSIITQMPFNVNVIVMPCGIPRMSIYSGDAFYWKHIEERKNKNNKNDVADTMLYFRCFIILLYVYSCGYIHLYIRWHVKPPWPWSNHCWLTLSLLLLQRKERKRAIHFLWLYLIGVE